MPFQSINDLPENVRKVLPEHALHIYHDAFNNAWKEYEKPDSRRSNEGREEVAHKVAWNAVKQKYEKDDDGKWRER